MRAAPDARDIGMTALLDVRDISKAYPGVQANADIAFDVAPGEIHALLGENGAGKSTLVKIIYGLVRPDAGRMTLDGRPFAPAGPHGARRAGVAMVFQHFSLFEALTVAENIALGMERPPRDLEARICAVSEDYGLALAPRRLVGDLSVGQRQRVEIVRCLLQDPRLLIMDEPTSVLTPQEVAPLFETLRLLAAEGRGILYISHKLDEIRALCDRATILRGGRVVATCVPREESARSLAEMMIGERLAEPPDHAFRPGDVRLAVEGLDLASDDPHGTSLREVSFALRAGEVLGVAGVAGNGQEELLRALSGEARVRADAIRLGARPVGQLGPNARRRLGLLAAPEERLGHAAAPDLTLAENAFLSGRVRRALTRHGFLRFGRIEAFTREIIRAFDVRTPGTDAKARALSGGNLQKFVIGREILQEPAVLVVNQPTWGVDARAAAAIRAALRDLAGRGAAVLVISQDLDELVEIADSFAVLAGGRLSPPQPAGALSIEAIGRMMGGGFAPLAREEEPVHAAR
jgi:general nucleoside transport system ATP-binding protein